MSYSLSRSARRSRAALACTVALAVVAVFSSAAFAGSMGVDVAYVSPEGFDGAIGFGAFMNFSTPMSAIQIEPFASYWSQTEGIAGAEASLSDFTVGARGKYAFPLTSQVIQPYVGAGFGLHFLKAGTDVSLLGETTNLSVTDSELGFDVGGGLSVPLSPRLSLRGEGWYSFVNSSEWTSFRIGAQFSM